MTKEQVEDLQKGDQVRWSPLHSAPMLLTVQKTHVYGSFVVIVQPSGLTRECFFRELST